MGSDGNRADQLLVVASDEKLKSRIAAFFSRLSQEPLQAVPSIDKGVLEMVFRPPQLLVVGFRYHDTEAAADVERLVRVDRRVRIVLVIACPLSREGDDGCGRCTRQRPSCTRRGRLVVLGAHDYIRLARKTGASMVIERHHPERISGSITIHNGEVWAAFDGEGEGEDALLRLLEPGTPALFSMRVAGEPTGDRHFEAGSFGSSAPKNVPHPQAGSFFPAGMIHAANESLALSRLSRRNGSRRRDRPLVSVFTNKLVNVDRTLAPDPAHSTEPHQLDDGIAEDKSGIERLVSTGLEAILERRYHEAVSLLVQAAALDPEFPRVAAALARLEKMGYA